MSNQRLKIVEEEVAGLLTYDVGWPQRDFVRIITCISPDFDFLAYARDHTGALKQELYAYGALLIRGLPPHVEQFAALCDLFGPPATHSELSSLRTRLGEGVYTSTDHPADQMIQMHNEQAYLSYWPKIASFMCVKPPTSGGQTPVADCRNFDEELPANLAHRLRTLGVKYVRNIGSESTIPWKAVYGVNSREELEAYCARRNIEVVWRPDGTPRTISTLPAYVRHPETTTDCFFNNIVSASHHSLAARQRAQIEKLFETPLDQPNSVLFGDGVPISYGEVQTLLSAYQRRTFQFDWREGDILIADNVLVAHARNPFQGTRKVVVRINDIHDALQSADAMSGATA
jgi:alpha-ketoglutarate-dependent taurine dioxygenase